MKRFPESGRGCRAQRLILTGCLGAALSGAALASSHNDAPQIQQDPQANLTDVYAFIGTKYNAPDVQVLNVIVNVRPFVEPGNGPHYDRFSDNALYSIHITDPANGHERQRYDFRFSNHNPLFSPGLKNNDTILSYGLGNAVGPITMIGGDTQNYTQTYSVKRTVGHDRDELGDDRVVAPPNPGANVTPDYNDDAGMAVSGAADLGSLDPLTTMAIHELEDGVVSFAGPRDDSFFADVPGVFDLLNVRILDNNGDLSDGLGQDGNGDDGFKGFNVLTYALQIPLGNLDDAESTYDSVFFGEQTGVGVYASVSRPRISILLPGQSLGIGGFIQVNRLGNPLFNEVLVAHEAKDLYNRLSPRNDNFFDQYAENPEVAALINFVFSTEFVTEGRDDLVAIFIPDVIRVSTTTGPVRLDGDPGFSRFGFIGGDTTASGVSSGWPNGRRLGDDVIDIALTAVASGPSYDPITIVGDNVAENDIAYNQVFPYAATPHSGTNVFQDGSGPGPACEGDSGSGGTLRPLMDADLNGDGVIDAIDVAIVAGRIGKTAE